MKISAKIVSILKLVICFSFVFCKFCQTFADDLPDPSKFYEMRGKNIACLHDDRYFNRCENGGIRWVKDLSLLWGTKQKEDFGVSEESRLVTDEVHERLAKLGTTLKIFNEYKKGFEDLTPDKTNFLVPYVSFIIKNGDSINFKTGDFLRLDSGDACVFNSGQRSMTSENLFNETFAIDDLPRVHILAGDESRNMSNLFKAALHDKSSFLYKKQYKKELFKKHYEFCNEIFQSLDQNNKKRFEPIVFTAQLLTLLQSGDLNALKTKQNTLKKLNGILTENDKSEFNPDNDFKDEMKREELTEAGLDRIGGTERNFLFDDQQRDLNLFLGLGYLSYGFELKDCFLDEVVKNIDTLPELRFSGKTFKEHLKVRARLVSN